MKSVADRLILSVTTVGSGLLALLLGQDNNFDQLNYHVYLGWSVLTGRLDLDIAPAGVGSYLNPLLHIPSYLGVAHLPPRVFGFALGAIHGLNAYLVYRLAMHVLKRHPAARLHAAIGGVVAMSGPLAVGLLGTTFGDNLLSIPILAAFLLVARAVDGQPRSARRALFAAGLLAGAAAGVKLTFGPFVVGLAAASLAVAACRRSWAFPHSASRVVPRRARCSGAATGLGGCGLASPTPSFHSQTPRSPRLLAGSPWRRMAVGRVEGGWMCSSPLSRWP